MLVTKYRIGCEWSKIIVKAAKGKLRNGVAKTKCIKRERKEKKWNNYT